VWLAVLAVMSELGLDTDEKLSALTHAQARSSECAPAAFLPRLTEVLNTVSFNDIQNAMKHQSYFR
jgi:hypothetical protein